MSKRFSFLFFLFCSVVIYAKENQKNSHQTEKNHTIPPVIVKAQKQNFEINDQKIIITHEQISTSGTTTLANVLQNLGGVQLQDITGNGSQVALSMRGFGVNSSSNTLLLINGIPITNPDLAPPDLNAIPLQEIKSIEIIAGSESVLYGDQAVGGVVNIITQQETIKKMFFVCDAGSFSTKNCSFTFNNQAGHLGYHFNLLSEKTNNYREHNDYTQNLFSGQLNYPYSRGKVSLDYHIANEFMQYPGALTEQQVHENRRQASNNTDFFRDNNYYLHLHQTQHFDNHWQLTTDISTRNMQGNGVLFSPFTQSRTTYFIRPTLKKSLNDTNFLYGIDLEKDRYQLNSAFGLNKDSQEKYGLFGMLNVPFKEKIIFYGGLRGALQHNHLVTNTTSYPVNRAFFKYWRKLPSRQYNEFLYQSCRKFSISKSR
ncbi:MAG: hypothetical protein A3F12_01875 [Gammaproteobacteria bacterium RIFCSPHIGHO2_12_FULL_38_14]|nr:MAG: hypothetical protein A3F12_01875 [Gammaproteobacteria bacterium RIFCSPHIGHO2_12_FULL_38_14]